MTSEELFGGLVINPSRARRARFAAPVSLVVHAVGLTLLILVSLSRVDPPPPERDYVRVPIYGPAVALPPLPKGTGEAERPRRPRAPDPQPVPAFTAPVEMTPVETTPTEFVPLAPADDLPGSAGSPLGDDQGIAEGSEAGKVGGQVGGVAWGDPRGVVGGTGEIPVANPDQPPRLLRKVPPQYPQQAFVQKVQGTVMLRILIGSDGRVLRADLTQRVHPLLDEAARTAVLQWVFAPAHHDGRPVATWAFAPFTFQLY